MHNTEDQWALQTVAGYKLDLLSAPWHCQIHMPHQVQTTAENATLITTDVAELLSKGAIVDTSPQLSPGSYMSQILWWRRRMGVKGW